MRAWDPSLPKKNEASTAQPAATHTRPVFEPSYESQPRSTCLPFPGADGANARGVPYPSAGPASWAQVLIPSDNP